jgi:Cytochrome C oxidase subunit II, periplasmic domain
MQGTWSKPKLWWGLCASFSLGLSVIAIGPAFSDNQELSAKTQELCGTNSPDPFRSAGDIQDEINCADAAMRMLEKKAGASRGMVLSVSTSISLWSYEYSSIAAGKNNRLCDMKDTIFVPAGEDLTFRLLADDTIYKFSIPKLDIAESAIPGRIEEITITAQPVGDLALEMLIDAGSENQIKKSIIIRFLAEKAYENWQIASLASNECSEE